MKISRLQVTIWTVFGILIVANVFAFLISMSRSQSIQTYEEQTGTLKLANSDLEEMMYDANSLQYAASRAADLSFTVKAQPYYLHSIGVAKRN